MSRNPIQFQKGLSLSEFQRRYGTEARCEAALKAWRWPDGFVCPHCGCRDHAIVGQRRLHLCHGCRRQTSLKAGTIFAKTLLPLTKWLQAMFLITQSKNSISSLELSRQLGVKYDSAWLMRQKLNAVMQSDEESRKLDGRIEMDDAVLGGEKGELEGGKRGRGGPNKIPFVVAVATSDEGRPQRLALMPVAAHNKDEIARIAELHLAPSARVVSDGLACFAAVTKAGCLHEPVVVSRTLTGRSETLDLLRLGEYCPRQPKGRRSEGPATRSAGLTFRATSPSSNGASTDGSICAACSTSSPPLPFDRLQRLIRPSGSRTWMGNQAQERPRTARHILWAVFIEV